MARPIGPTLTDHELSIMQILWERSLLTVQEILDVFPRTPKPAYNSLLTAVRALEKKKILAHKKDGKAYRYYPVLLKAKYKRSALQRLLSHTFDGNAYDLAVNLIKEEAIGADDLQKLKQLLEQM